MFLQDSLVLTYVLPVLPDKNPISGKIFRPNRFRDEYFHGRKNFEPKNFLIFQLSNRKKSGKKFSARKKGVSYPSDCRIIIRSSDVQLTKSNLFRRNFSGSSGFCTKNSDRPGGQHFFARKKIRILVFELKIFPPVKFQSKKIPVVRIFEREKPTDIIKKVPAQPHAISAERMHPIKIAPNVPAPPILTCGTSRSPT